MAETAIQKQKPTPGFGAGVSAFARGFRLIQRDPELWPFALVPALVFSVLEAAFVTLALRVARPWVLARLPEATSTLGRFGADVAAALAVFAVAALGWFIAVALAPPLSAPALERIVKRVEQQQRSPARAPLGFFAEMVCGLKAMTGAFLAGLPLFALLSLAEMVFPVVAAVTVPLRFVLSSLLLAWGLFDYPLTLRGAGFRNRFALLREHLACFLGFGLTFALAFWLPCCGVILLPVGVAAATSLLPQLEATSQKRAR